MTGRPALIQFSFAINSLKYYGKGNYEAYVLLFGVLILVIINEWKPKSMSGMIILGISWVVAVVLNLAGVGY